MRYGKFGLLVAGAAAVAASVGVLVGGGAAIAAGGGGPTPPWEGSISQGLNGAITFYNAQGQVVTGGSITTGGLATYAVASTPDPRSGDIKATLFAYTPVPNENPAQFSGEELTVATPYPNSSFPAPIGTTANPVVVSHSTDVPFSQYIETFPNTQTASGFAGLYDIRMKVTGLGGLGQETAYWDTVISVNTKTNTWSVDFPDWTQNTTTKLTASPSTEATSAPITLTATVSPTAASGGTVSFWNGTTQVGTTQKVSGGTASVTATPGTGTTNYTAIFTPPVGSADIGSTGTLSYLVGSGPVSTTTKLTASPPSPVNQGSSVTLTSTVAAASGSTTPAGTVEFEDNGTALGSGTVNGSGVATLPPTKLAPSAPGGASLTATFMPANPSTFSTSTSAALSYTVNPVATKPALSGAHKVGATETCSEGNLAAGVTASYKWTVGGKTVGSSAKLTVPASADNKTLTCTASVHDGSGPVSAMSNSVKVTPGTAPRDVRKPTLSGPHKVGKTETVKPGTWSPRKVSFSYQWLLNGKVIKHATKSSFKPTRSDRHKKLSCRVTAHEAGHSNGVATTSSVKVS